MARNTYQHLHGRARTRFFNLISGIKSANLIGTHNTDGLTNLAVFNSVVHIGANPATMGFINRPLTVERHTYENIRSTRQFTINAISRNMVERAHATSAKYDRRTSEFKACGFEPYYAREFDAPFVRESPIQIGLEYTEEHPLSNGTILIVGNVVQVQIADGAVEQDGNINLSQLGIVGVSGLENYHETQLYRRMAYARPDESSRQIR